MMNSENNYICDDNGNRVRIVYVVENLFTERDYKRFFVKELEQNGFEVLVIDVTRIFKPEIDISVALLPDYNQPCRMVICKNISDFYNTINRFEPHFCWSFISPALKDYFNRLRITFFLNRKAKVIETNVENLPFGWSRFSVKKIIRSILFIPWTFLKPAFSYVTNQRALSVAKGKPIKVHELDYDLYLKANSLPHEYTGEPYLLFLDEDCPFHSDFIYHGVKNPFTAEVYYKEVNNALQTLADRLQLKAVVQLHPRANQQRSISFYQAEISNKPTAEAIRDASLVVGHASTAIQMAVLFRKPLILLKTKQYEQLILAFQILLNFQMLLKCPAVWTNEVEQISSMPDVDLNAYTAYEEIYTRVPGTPKIFSYEIFAEFLIKEFITENK